jgi:hypothetical protein
MRRSPPLRFLVVVLGGWAALRAAFIAPPWSTPPAGAAAAPNPARTLPTGGCEVPQAPGAPLAAAGRSVFAAAIPPSRGVGPVRPNPTPAVILMPPPGGSIPPAAVAAAAVPFAPAPYFVPPPRPDPDAPRRWSLSAWSFVRRGNAAPLAAAGLLGGSQAGARLTYRINRDPARPLALSVRLSGPLRDEAGAEVALGLDWRPVGRLPVHLLAERRQALGRDGRSAFGLTAFGGVSDAPLGRFRIDAYAQTGLVGARSLDLFGDGSVRLSLPLGGSVRVGAGAWAAAQPGLSRVAADWRLRVAGNADPGSGPTLTVATDF